MEKETKEKIEKRIVFEGKGVVWDPSQDKALCTFVNGKLITDNQYIINKLKEMGKFKYRKYNPLEEEKVVTPEGEIERLGHWIMNNCPAEEGFPVDIAIRIMNNYVKLKEVERINKQSMQTLQGAPV